jgi:threonylcarbamoyladenosine tRNA methylthiotransferase MtaB
MLQFKKAAFYTLGCKLNFSETSTIAKQIVEAGYARVKFEDQPDVYVINTCSVTDNADKKCRAVVRKALRVNPEAVIIVIGCYAQLKPDEIASIPGVNLVLGAEEKFNVVDFLEHSNIADKGQVAVREIKHTKHFVPGYSSGDRTRTFLKVQDGCNYFCAFCTIPLARGRSRSADVATTLAKAREAVDAGAKEIVLTGVNIGDFGHGSDENFYQLVQALDEIEGVERFRISSIEPNLLSDDLIAFVAQSRKFVPHFHIPLQSGSDEVLTAMRRRYRTDLYRSRVERIKQCMPEACIGVDVIVGFPGETEALFAETQQFLTDLPISYLHVFTYSERPNTTALRIAEVVPMEVRSGRNKALRLLSHRKLQAFYRSELNKVHEVLFEAEEDAGMMYGFTRNYIRVKLPFESTLVNQITQLKLSSIGRDHVVTAQRLPMAVNS